MPAPLPPSRPIADRRRDIAAYLTIFAGPPYDVAIGFDRDHTVWFVGAAGDGVRLLQRGWR